MSLSMVRYGSSDCPVAAAAAKSRGRSAYFSEFRYSSLPALTGSHSYSSYPEYTPQVGENVEARVARMANIAGPPVCSDSCRMSGVLTNMFGRHSSARSACIRANSVSSALVVRQVKYV
jgi:hypothetical protein